MAVLDQEDVGCMRRALELIHLQVSNPVAFAGNGLESSFGLKDTEPTGFSQVGNVCMHGSCFKLAARTVEEYQHRRSLRNAYRTTI